MFFSSVLQDGMSEEYIDRYQLNEDQARALLKVANMFKVKQQQTDSLTLIHGQFRVRSSFNYFSDIIDEVLEHLCKFVIMCQNWAGIRQMLSSIGQIRAQIWCIMAYLQNTYR